MSNYQEKIGWRSALRTRPDGQLQQLSMNVRIFLKHDPELCGMMKFDPAWNKAVMVHEVGSPGNRCEPRGVTRHDRFNIICWMEVHGISKRSAITDGIDGHIADLEGR